MPKLPEVNQQTRVSPITGGRRRVKIDPWSPGFRITWTPEAIKSALFLHQQGDFTQITRLSTAMLQDDELPQDLAVSTNLIVGAPFQLQPVDANDGEPEPASLELSGEYQTWWEEVHPAVEMANMFDWYEMIGIALGTYDWRVIDGEWTPRFRALNPENLWFSESEINPQTKLHGVLRYRSRTGDDMVTPGDGKWVLWSEGNQSWTQCACRALGYAWLGKQQTFRDLLRFNERHGLPIVVAKIPSFSEDGTDAAVLNDIKAIGSDTTISLPKSPQAGHYAGSQLRARASGGKGPGL